MRWTVVVGGFLLLSFVCSPLIANEIIFFQNQRAVEATSYYIKGGLIYITLTNGREVYMRANQVNWEATEKINIGNAVMRKLPYEQRQELEAATKITSVSKLDGLSNKPKGIRKQRKKTKDFIIRGSRVWTDTGIILAYGQQALITASGTIRLFNSEATPPGGLGGGQASGAARIMPEKPLGCLIGRVGLKGKPFYLGPGKILKSPSEGHLYLGPNVQNPAANTGAWDVSILIPKSGEQLSGGFSSTSFYESGSPAGAASTTPAGFRQDFKTVRSGY
ncbi:hypothetical protein ACFLU6_04475 [Acidobacteriota bacterium]